MTEKKQPFHYYGNILPISAHLSACDFLGLLFQCASAFFIIFGNLILVLEMESSINLRGNLKIFGDKGNLTQHVENVL